MEEIRRSPVDMVSIPFFTGFYTGQVVQDFSFHQQYLIQKAYGKMSFLSHYWDMLVACRVYLPQKNMFLFRQHVLKEVKVGKIIKNHLKIVYTCMYIQLIRFI